MEDGAAPDSANLIGKGTLIVFAKPPICKDLPCKCLIFGSAIFSLPIGKIFDYYVRSCMIRPTPTETCSIIIFQLSLIPGLQSMAVFNEISGVQEQNIECASVQFDLGVHFKCTHKILNLYLEETLTRIVKIVVKNIPIQRLFCPVFRRKQFGPKI